MINEDVLSSESE